MDGAGFCTSTDLPPDSGVGRPTIARGFPEAGPYRYAILDRDSTFDDEVVNFLKATGLKPKGTGAQAPWQNRIAERWVGSCRREILHHVIALTNHIAAGDLRLRELLPRRSDSR